MSKANLTHLARANSAVILALFGAAWLLAWRYQAQLTSPVVLPAILAAAALIASSAFLQARRIRLTDMKVSADLRNRSLRLYGLINFAQWLLIFAVASALGSAGYPQWVASAVILIVGLHFFPLAHVFKDRLHYFTGMSLVLLACIYPVVSKSGPNDPIGMLGAGIILWVSAVASIAVNGSLKWDPLRSAAN